jgi:hypothetical protein
MTNDKKIIDGMTFRVGTQKLKIYELFKEGKSINEIVTITGFPLGNVKAGVHNFKKLSAIVTSENVEISDIPTNQLLILEFKEDGDDMILYTKTSPLWEKYLQETKEKRTTQNFFGENKIGYFYHLKLVNNYLDDINQPLIVRGEINFAVLRVPGVSNGMNFKVNRLMSESQKKSALKKMVLTFKDFYKKSVEGVNSQVIRAEVLEEL